MEYHLVSDKYIITNKEKKLIVHIVSPEKKRKKIIIDKLKGLENICVQDLSEFYNLYSQDKSKLELKNYKQHIFNFNKKNQDKIIIYIGLDNNTNVNNEYINTEASLKYYIDVNEKVLLKHKFFKQIDKLNKGKEWFINEYFINGEIHETINNSINLDKWKNKINENKQFYINRGYKLLNRKLILKEIQEKI